MRRPGGSDINAAPLSGACAATTVPARRMRRRAKMPFSLSSPRVEYEKDSVDFSAAGLYLVGIQAILTNVVCAVASILSCWLLPRAAVSAVRTLTICTIVAFFGMFKPLRVGNVRGVDMIFNALQPLVPLYILALVVEQLVHTCAPSPDEFESGIGWRRALFQLLVLAMMISGFVRAAHPNSEIDFGFALTSGAMLAIAVLPPPALPLAGPLCEPSALFAAGERILRAVFFAMLYCIHVYTAPPNKHNINELVLCILRSSAASIWVLGAHPLLLITAPAQAAVAIYKRFGRSGDCLPYTSMMADEDEMDHAVGPSFFAPTAPIQGVIAPPAYTPLGEDLEKRLENGTSSIPSSPRQEEDGGIPVSASMLASLARPLCGSGGGLGGAGANLHGGFGGGGAGGGAGGDAHSGCAGTGLNAGAAAGAAAGAGVGLNAGALASATGARARNLNFNFQSSRVDRSIPDRERI